MKLKTLLLSTIFGLATLPMLAQEGGIKGKVVSRNGREAVGNVTVTIDGVGTATTDQDGNFSFQNLPQGSYKLSFEAADFENLDLVVSVEQNMRDLNNVVVVPTYTEEMDDSIFAEFDSEEASSDSQALPSSLSASKDLFTNIASYKFSEMRFNLRGYDSQYNDIYLNGIRFNDAMTGYGPWSLWSGLNDATRNQESTSGLQVTDYGIGGISGSSNINARASQMRKGFRVSVTNGNSMYRLRAMVSYASGALDNGWSYAFSVSTRQGGNGYVDGIYYNSYGYFASVEKLFGSQHRLALTVLGTPQQRGAQQASTDEAYSLFGSNYYNPNVGYQNGVLRNSRVRDSHEPIAMLNYTWDISERTRLNAAAAVRFGYNGYSALTWNDGVDPRPDYYRKLPSYFLKRGMQDITESGRLEWIRQAIYRARNWNPYIDFDDMIRSNYDYRDLAAEQDNPALEGKSRSNYMIEERHTDQVDFNFAANISHEINNRMRIVAGLRARVNRTEYYDEVKDLLGGNYWLDVDKFAERDLGYDPFSYQNDMYYYITHGHARAAQKGDKISYDYYANVREAQLWAQYGLHAGGFSMGLGAEVGYTAMWRTGRLVKGLFPTNSYGPSETLDYLTYNVRGNFAYRFSGAHSLSANVTMMQNAPTFQSSFVSPRTRNDATPNLKPEKVFSAELTYSLSLPWIKARLSGYYTTFQDQSKVISFYDDTQSSFTNFAMSGIDKRHYGMELGVSVPVVAGLTLNGALSLGDYSYTSDPSFTQIVDNRAEVVLEDKVMWKGMYVESSPQFAANVGLNYRGPRNWFASVDFNYYDNLYLSMNPMYRTAAAVKAYIENLNMEHVQAVFAMRGQEKFDSAYTLGASIGKNWYIQRKYTLGFSLQVNNILNDRTIHTGGYEQMRLNRVRKLDKNGAAADFYERFDSKYFYMLGTTYYLNIYFRF